MRPSIEELYMKFALSLTERVTCKRAAVACVIASSDLEQIISFGYNGTAKGFPHDDCREEEVGNCGCIHAEANAIAKLAIKDKDKVFFITNEPCEICAKLIVNSGASQVYFFQTHIRPVGGIDVLKKAKIPIGRITLL